MIRRSAAVVTILALALLSGPVSLAEIATSPGTDRPSKASKDGRKLRTPWPGGSAEEQWHSRDELSLYLQVGVREVEVRYRGTGGVLDTWVIIGNERSPIDIDNIRDALRDSRGGTGTLIPERLGKTLSHRNRETLEWIDETTGGSALALTRVDKAYMGRMIARAEDTGLEKNSCAEHGAVGTRYAGLWLLCISAVVSSGTTLGPCFLLGGGVYFHGYQTLEACHGGGARFPGCNCSGPAPECMCCPGLEEGDDCKCYCGGSDPEECCEWPDAEIDL